MFKDIKPLENKYTTEAHFIFTEDIKIVASHTVYMDPEKESMTPVLTVYENKSSAARPNGPKSWRKVSEGPVCDLVKTHFLASEAYQQHIKKFQR